MRHGVECLVPSPTYLVGKKATDGSTRAPTYSASDIDVTTPGGNLAYRNLVWLTWLRVHIQDVGIHLPAIKTETKEVIPAPPKPAMARPSATCQKVWPAPLSYS